MNNRRTQIHSNTNFRAAKPMDIYQIGAVACSWLMHYQFIAAFVGPASPGMLTVVWFLAWATGIIMALVIGGFYADYFKAEKRGTESPEYAALMTDQPMPPLPVTAVTALMLVIVSVTANDAGFHALSLLHMAVAISGSAIFVLRRDYHSRIGS